MEILNQTGDAIFHAWMDGRTGPDGKTFYLDQYIIECEITESIDTPCIYARLVIDDSGDLITNLDGGERWNIEIKSKHRNQTYKLESFKVSDYVRQEKRAVYMIHLASGEFLRNELSNVFGAFKEQKASEHVCEIMTKKKFKTIGKFTEKKVFIEKTDASFTFVATNWRVFNCINWLCEKSIRANKSGSVRQSGFILYENVFGFHFTSLDKLIEDSKKQSPSSKTIKQGTNCGERPIPPLYKYTYGQKNLGQNNPEENEFLIDKLTFPKSYSLLDQIRHGTLSGYTQAFDPVELAKGSSNDPSKDTPVSTRQYLIEEVWGSMAHVEKAKPYKGAPDYLYTVPRRHRLKPILSRTFGVPGDKKAIAAGGKNFQDIVDSASYSYLRLKSFMYQQLSIQFAGNLDIYAGYGIEVEIPKNLPDKPSDKKIPVDKRWSGKWMVAGVTHRFKSGKLTTNCLLVRDSTQEKAS